MSHNFTALQMKHALKELDTVLEQSVQLVLGGGGAMILAHGFPLSTTDIDAVPKGISINELDVFVKKVAEKLKLPPDWLNPYFGTFAHTLPSDYGSRLITVFEGTHLKVGALSLNEMLIMKCFAHRQKDISHARALLKKGADADHVEAHIEALKRKNIPGASEALKFLIDLLDQESSHEDS